VVTEISLKAVDAMNRGYEGTAQHQMEMKNGLSKLGMPVMTFEGNMADEREFDEARTARMIDLFVTKTFRAQESSLKIKKKGGQ